MNSAITIKDVAQMANVSIGTVSRVFNNHANVTEEMQQRVLQAAARLGYSRLAKQDVSTNGHGQVREIGFLYCSSVDTGTATGNPFWSHILGGVESEARKTSIKVTYRAVGELVQNPQMFAATVQNMKLGGVLLVGPAEPETIALMQGLNIPLVLIDNYILETSIDSVLCDNFEGARIAIDYLIKAGHQRIAFIGGPIRPGLRPTNRIYTLERRAAGYRTALLDAGLTVDYELFESCSLCAESSYEACKRLLARNVQFTALFGANDEIAIGAMKALRDTGHRVPEDISVVGFDDIDMVEHLTPALTTVQVNKEALGSVAVRQLLARAADPEMVGVTCILEVKLVERESVQHFTLDL